MRTIQKACAEGLSAEALINRLIGAVQEFVGEEVQGDDMTCVVLRVES
jgi:serine phosphatase RsbU (regulator of sigma subunit)